MTPKEGTRPWTPVGSFANKEAAKSAAFNLSGVGANGKPIVFEACRLPGKHPKKSSGKWAIRRVM